MDLDIIELQIYSGQRYQNLIEIERNISNKTFYTINLKKVAVQLEN